MKSSILFNSSNYFPKRLLKLDVGGHRLEIIRNAFHSDSYGIDPSSKDIEDGKSIYPNNSFQVGTADNLPFDDDSFDMVIFGFCLYLCDRKDLFKIAYEADRCLKNKGTLVIKDFCPPFPYKNNYSQ